MMRYIAYAVSAISVIVIMTWLALHEPALRQYPNASDLSVSSALENQGAAVLPEPTSAAQASQAERTDTAQERRLQKLARQVQQLQQKLQAQRNEVAHLARALAAAQPSALEAAPAGPAPEPSAEERDQADREWEQHRLAQLDGVFEREPWEPTWSPEAAQQIVSAAAQVARDASGSGTALVDVQCRASLCRLEVV